MIVAEESLPGKIGFVDYRNLLSFGPGMCGILVFFFACLVTALAQLSTSFTLANWTAQSFEEQQSTAYYPWMFAGSVALYILCSLLRAIVTFWMIGVSTTNLHNAVSKRVIRSIVLFFDSNPVGRIVTRFSKDVTVLDFVIPIYVVFIAQGMFRSLTVTATVGIINPWLFIAVAIAIALMVYILRKGVKPMQDAQRLDSMLRGPIHTTYSMVIQGLVTLRAFDKLAYFKQDFNNTLEKCANATFCFSLTNRWVGLRLDLVCVLITIATTGIAFLQKGVIQSELLILSL